MRAKQIFRLLQVLQLQPKRLFFTGAREIHLFKHSPIEGLVSQVLGSVSISGRDTSSFDPEGLPRELN